METLPDDVLSLVLNLLTSKERADICSVSNRIEKLSILASQRLSQFPLLFDSKYTRFTKILKSGAKKIVLSGDYHLIVRLKNKQLLSPVYACKSGNIDLINLIVRKRADIISGIFNNLIKGCDNRNAYIVANIAAELELKDKIHNGLGFGLGCQMGDDSLMRLMWYEFGAVSCYWCWRNIEEHFH